MKPTVLIPAFFMIAAFTSSGFATEFLKADPPAGKLIAGQVVYVDDGTCPKGQVKKVIGAASRETQRLISCAARPK